MNPELTLVVLPAAGWLLWTWGGFNWKPARWAVWPALIGLFALLRGLVWWRVLLAVVIIGWFRNLGYGPKSRLFGLLQRLWRIEIVLGVGYALSLLLLQCSWWVLVVGVYFPLAMRLSRKWWPAWTHKYVEGFTGLFDGLAAS